MPVVGNSSEPSLTVMGAMANALIVTAQDLTDPELELDALTLSLQPIRRRLTSVHHDFDAVKVSPDGRHVAWMALHATGESDPPWLSRIKQLWRINEREYVAIWTSRLDGSERKQIGQASSSADSAGLSAARRRIEDWGWDFQGHALWFEHNGAYRRTPRIY